ncbi:MAG: hypothetical protein ACI9T7_000109 [Oleiphilaceae bacterium]|jgi:hypothetical protein
MIDHKAMLHTIDIELESNSETYNIFLNCIPIELSTANNLNQLGIQVWGFMKLEFEAGPYEASVNIPFNSDAFSSESIVQSLATILKRKHGIDVNAIHLRMSNLENGLDKEEDKLYRYLSGDIDVFRALMATYVNQAYLRLGGNAEESKAFNQRWELSF